jgi:hypothetical protein
MDTQQSVNTPLQKIKYRLQSLGIIQKTLLKMISPAVRLISFDWESRPWRLYCYFHLEPLQQDVETIETACTRLAIPLAKCDCAIIQLDEPSPIAYPGECIYARKEEGSKNAPFRKEHSTISEVDVEALLQKKQFTVLHTYPPRASDCSAELLDFHEPVGYYLNPTTRKKEPTERCIVYSREAKKYFLAAVPNLSWFEKLQKECQEQGLWLDFETHIYREASRAILGKVLPEKTEFSIDCLTPSSYHFCLHLDEGYNIDEETAVSFDLIRYEILAGLPPECDFDFTMYGQPKENTIFYRRATCLYAKQKSSNPQIVDLE